MAAHKKRFCVHGHDTWVVGRVPNGQCRECDRETSRKYGAEHPERVRARYWDLTPIERVQLNTRRAINRSNKQIKEHYA